MTRRSTCCATASSTSRAGWSTRPTRRCSARSAPTAAPARCVYKPVAGERPLWDFPDGTLAGREVAAYAVSEATGWDVVPPTVLRDGPFGPGHVPAVDRHRPRRVDLVDVVAPAALPDGWLRVLDALGAGGEPVVLGARRRRRGCAGWRCSTPSSTTPTARAATCCRAGRRVRGVDHGVTFHIEPKLRTVLWGWAGEPLAADRASRCSSGCATTCWTALGTRAGSSWSRRAEVHGLPAARRAAAAAEGHLPFPVEGWPAIPWPPF